MQLIFRLPILLLEALMRQGAEVLSGIVALLRGGGEEAPAPPAARTPSGPPQAERAPRFTANGPPPPTAEEALARRFEREAAAPPPPAPAEGAAGRLRPVAEEPHVDREPEIVESFGDPDEVGATLTVDEPWEGYATQSASAIVSRLRGADEATKGVVRLYEQMHKKRATVLKATT
jgi:hypothetical protein